MPWISADRTIGNFNPATGKGIDMTPDIKILHIAPDYKILLMVIEKETSRVTPLSLREALEIVKTEKLDLILSEPQHMAIFDKTASHIQ